MSTHSSTHADWTHTTYAAALHKAEYDRQHRPVITPAPVTEITAAERRDLLGYVRAYINEGGYAALAEKMRLAEEARTPRPLEDHHWGMLERARRDKGLTMGPGEMRSVKFLVDEKWLKKVSVGQYALTAKGRRLMEERGS